MDFIIKGNPKYEVKHSDEFYKKLKDILGNKVKFIESTEDGYNKFKKEVDGSSKVLSFSRGCGFGPWHKWKEKMDYKSVGIGCSEDYDKPFKPKKDYLYQKYPEMNHMIINNKKDETISGKFTKVPNHWKITPEMEKKIKKFIK